MQVKGRVVTLWLNGVAAGKLELPEGVPAVGPVGLEAEGVTYRNLRVKALK